MKIRNKSLTSVLKGSKTLLMFAILALLGAAAYLFVGWYSGIDAQTSIGPNIGLGMLGLLGVAVFWGGILGTIVLLIYQFVK